MQRPATLMLLALVTLGASAQQAQNPDNARPPRPARKVQATPASVRPQGISAVSTAASGGLHSQPRVLTLPALALTDIDGHPADIASMARKGHWLLLLSGNGCVPCNRVFDAFAASNSSAMRSGAGMVVVVASSNPRLSPANFSQLRAKYNSFNQATWLEDSAGSMVAALHPHGEPVLYALDGDRITWSVPGTLGSPQHLEALAAAWLASSPKVATPVTP